MLAKLIKYDLKYILKTARIFIILLLTSVLIFNFTSYVPELITEIQDGQPNVVGEIVPPLIIQALHGLAQFAIYAFIFALVFIVILSIWRRFKNNFYGDEAYLTHTLPLSRHTLWTAKFCSTLIAIAVVILTLIFGCFLLSFSTNGLQLLESFGLVYGCTHCVGNYYFVEPQSFSLYASYILLFFTQISFITFCGITGIIIGHRTNRHQGRWSLLSEFTVYFIWSFLLIGILYIISLINPDFSFIFGEPISSGAYVPDDPRIPARISNFINPEIITQLFLIIATVYLCYIIIQYFTSQKLLEKGINLD